MSRSLIPNVSAFLYRHLGGASVVWCHHHLEQLELFLLFPEGDVEVNVLVPTWWSPSKSYSTRGGPTLRLLVTANKIVPAVAPLDYIHWLELRGGKPLRKCIHGDLNVWGVHSLLGNDGRSVTLRYDPRLTSFNTG
jgi:hypothetical protein